VLGLVALGLLAHSGCLGGYGGGTFYLMLPYTGINVAKATMLADCAEHLGAGGVRLPVLAGVLAGVAAATTYFPALLFPLWLSFYWKRGAGRFAAAFLSPPRWPSPLSH